MAWDPGSIETIVTVIVCPKKIRPPPVLVSQAELRQPEFVREVAVQRLVVLVALAAVQTASVALVAVRTVALPAVSAPVAAQRAAVAVPAAVQTAARVGCPSN